MALIVMTLIVPTSFISEKKTEDFVVFVNTIIKDRIVYVDRNNLATLKSYRDGLSMIESTDDYKSRRIDKYIWVKKTRVPVYSQYWGRYQIGRDERESLGLKNVSWEVYSNSPELQDAACNLLIANVRHELMNYPTRNESKELVYVNYIEQYSGKVIVNHYLTESGMIAMAHNAGVTGLITFLKKRGAYIPTDGLKTKSTAYLSLANYNVNIVVDEARTELRAVMDSLGLK